jgi:hypothetical protein
MIPPELPNELGGCSGSNCWGDSLSDAIKFDCPNGAAQGCTEEVYSSYFNGDVYYSIVASAFPQIGVPNEPNWANCSYNSYVLRVAGIPPEPSSSGFGYCVPIDSASFVIAMPAPPPA